MKFCPDCSNCLYIEEVTQDEKKILKNSCRNCGYSEERTNNKVDEFQFDYDGHKKLIVPEELTYDKTYLRTRVVECPNTDCICNKDEKVAPEVLYYRQKNSLKLHYVCCHCNTMWKN